MLNFSCFHVNSFYDSHISILNHHGAGCKKKKKIIPLGTSCDTIPKVFNSPGLKTKP